MKNIIQKSATFSFTFIVFAIGSFCQDQHESFPKNLLDNFLENISENQQVSLPKDFSENIYKNMPKELPENLNKHYTKLKEASYEWGKAYNLNLEESGIIIQIALNITDIDIVKKIKKLTA